MLGMGTLVTRFTQTIKLNFFSKIAVEFIRSWIDAQRQEFTGQYQQFKN